MEKELNDNAITWDYNLQKSTDQVKGSLTKILQIHVNKKIASKHTRNILIFCYMVPNMLERRKRDFKFTQEYKPIVDKDRSYSRLAKTQPVRI
jgi:hypothetical protein